MRKTDGASDDTNGEKTKVDLNAISKEDKITHSFKQQLNKQKNKYESQLAERNREFEELKSRLERLENPDKYKEKFRNDFENDDKYIDYLVEQRMNKMFAEREEQYKKQRTIDEQKRERSNKINERINKCFATDDEKRDYLITVQQAFDQGLEELIDKEQYVSEYIQNSENGPRLLYDLASKPELVKAVFSQADPMSRILELKLYERELLKGNEQKKAVPTIKPNLVIGKPGISTNKTTDIFSNDAELKAFIRKR